MKYSIEDIKGVIPALITSFDRDEKLDKQRIRIVVKNLLEEKKMKVHLQNQKAITTIDLLLKKVTQHLA